MVFKNRRHLNRSRSLGPNQSLLLGVTAARISRRHDAGAGCPWGAVMPVRREMHGRSTNLREEDRDLEDAGACNPRGAAMVVCREREVQGRSTNLHDEKNRDLEEGGASK